MFFAKDFLQLYTYTYTYTYTQIHIHVHTHTHTRVIYTNDSVRHVHVDNFDDHLRNAQLVYEFFQWMLEVSLLFCVDRDPMNHFGDSFYNVVRYKRNNDIPVRVQTSFFRPSS